MTVEVIDAGLVEGGQLSAELATLVGRVLAADRKGGEALLEKCAHVAEARGKAPRGQWGSFLALCGLHERQAQRLIAIGERAEADPRFRDAVLRGFLSYSVAALAATASDDAMAGLLERAEPPKKAEAAALLGQGQPDSGVGLPPAGEPSHAGSPAAPSAPAPAASSAPAAAGEPADAGSPSTPSAPRADPADGWPLPHDWAGVLRQAENAGMALTFDPATGATLLREPDGGESRYSRTAWDQCRGRVAFLASPPADQAAGQAAALAAAPPWVPRASPVRPAAELGPIGDALSAGLAALAARPRALRLLALWWALSAAEVDESNLPGLARFDGVEAWAMGAPAEAVAEGLARSIADDLAYGVARTSPGDLWVAEALAVDSPSGDSPSTLATPAPLPIVGAVEIAELVAEGVGPAAELARAVLAAEAGPALNPGQIAELADRLDSLVEDLTDDAYTLLARRIADLRQGGGGGK